MIDWNDLLGPDKHKQILEKMYADKTIETMAIHLGVSVNALRKKMLMEGITMKPRGGVDATTGQMKSRLDSLPREEFVKTPIRAIAAMFDMCPAAVYKYMKRKGITREAIPRKTVEVEESGLPSESAVDKRELETEPAEEPSREPVGSEPGATGEVSGGIQSADVEDERSEPGEVREDVRDV